MKYYAVYFALILVSLYSEQCTEGAQILGVFPLAAKSVNILYQRLLKGLADAGHSVTTISAYEFELSILDGSVRDVLLTGFAEEFDNMTNGILTELQQVQSTKLFKNDVYSAMVLELYNRTYYHPNVRRFRNLKPKFDLVITDHIWSESLLGFATIFRCPSVVIATMGGINPFVNDMVGNSLPPSYVPHLFLPGDFSKGLNFFDRLYNFLFYAYDITFNYLYSFPAHNKILKSAFRKNPPDVAKLYHNVSMVLLGSHTSINQATPLVPNEVEIGGFHIDPPEELPEDIKRFLDRAKKGAIYFSMGSVIQSKNLPDERKKMFLNIFRKLKIKVIWKYEDDVLPDKPSNVLIKQWVPQTDVLGHPNVKLFISQGGHSSMLESIYHGVPALMIPVFGDQFNNANQAHAQGYALKLPYNDKQFNEKTLFALIKELLDNPKYAENAKNRSKIFHDRPMKPLDTAIYWIEYVIRHRGADHLKVAGLKLPLYKLYMLDVILVLVVMFSMVLFGLSLCLRKMCHKQPARLKIKQK